MKVLVILALICGVSTVYAAEENNGPCKQIKQACEAAGFVKDHAKEGFGLWVDCIRPIMKSEAQPKKAVKPLPKVDASVIAACKAKRPTFGEGKNAQKK